MDQMPTPNQPMQQAMPASGGHKGIALFFAVIVILALGGLGYWMMTVRPQAKNDQAGDVVAQTPKNGADIDTSAAIQSDLDGVNVDEVNTTDELKDVDAGIKQL